MSQSEQVKDFVSKALIGIERLIHMVQQLLILSWLDAGQEQEAPKVIHIDSMLEEIIDELKSQRVMSHNNILVNNRMHSKWVGRETQIRILLRNLLDNACRYAEDHTQISVQISDTEIVIRNVCAYMSTAMLQQSLERFKRGSSSQ